MYKNISQYLNVNNIEKYEDPDRSKKLNITRATKDFANVSSPDVWGPPTWLSLHISASQYPENASNLVKERMKNRILALPLELPCTDCRTHCANIIQKIAPDLDTICSTRDNLFKFYVDLHNMVNSRLNKPVMSLETAWKMYRGGVNLTTITYN